MPRGIYERTEFHRKINSLSHSGPKSKQWKGGRNVDNRGYIRIWTPEHPFSNNNRYVLEHRLVMEQWLCEHEPNHPALIEIEGKKYIGPEWAVHHINEKIDDNRIENLEILTHSKHAEKYHTPSHYGIHHSEETKQKISEALKSRLDTGRTLEERYGMEKATEIKRKISEQKKGKTKSIEHKLKLSFANKGKHHSEEIKQKISKGLKNYLQNNQKVLEKRKIDYLNKKRDGFGRFISLGRINR